MVSTELLLDAGVAVAVLGTSVVAFWLFKVQIDHRAHYGIGAHCETDLSEKTNCASCGARVDADREECRYCGEPVANGG